MNAEKREKLGRLVRGPMYDNLDEPARENWRQAGEAVYRLALEDAANAADDYIPERDSCGVPADGPFTARAKIAVAIRALGD